MADLFLLGRVIFGGFFVYSGIHHFVDVQSMAQYAGAKGVPMPEAAILFTGLLLLAGGLSILLGLWPHIGAACLILFFAGVTPAMHNFWAVADPAQRMMEMGNFMKNAALMGGALMLFGVPTPWPYSLESRLRRRIGV
jgi:putative oxidoreductase